ncbi:PHP domain-containing protein [Candidatus Woesearchaeota archaeon]|nr:PHP domain-containing protein [Candidatus Woesearchaeota archaeon]
MRYDLHMHTHYSKCSNLKPETILKLAKKRNLNGIAITDHHEIKGALEVKKLNKDKNFEVIVGEEISTNYGDVLVYYLNKKINFVDFFVVVDEVRKQNALITIAHPFRTTLIHNHKFQVPIENVKDKIDAVECFNARTLPGDNAKANKIADKLGIAKTAGSDSHFFFEIGTAYTIFDGNLREALKRKETKVNGTIRYGVFGGILSYLRKRLL